MVCCICCCCESYVHCILIHCENSNVLIPPFQKQHDGHHTCNSPQQHLCDASCPSCMNVCQLPYNHSGLHDTKHGPMVNTQFVVRPGRSREVEIFPPSKTNQQRSMKFFENQDGTKFTCDMYCRVLGRGHTHLVLCDHENPHQHHHHRYESTSPNNTNSPTSNEDSEKFCPYDSELSLMAMGRRHNTFLSGTTNKSKQIDELTHVKFWELSGFKDPTVGKEFVSDKDRKTFNKCRVISKHQYVNESTGAIQENYCTRHVSHDLLDVFSSNYLEEVSLLAERFPSGGFSPSGHHFAFSYAYHHYVLIDCSKNMSDNDIVPSMKLFVPVPPAPHQQGTPEEFVKFHNRMGFASELVLRYLHIRYKLNPKDKFTIILFNKKHAEVLVEDESTSHYYSFMDLMLSHCKPSNSTKYKNGFDKLLELLEKHSTSNKNLQLQPKVLLVSGGKLESKKKNASVSGAPRWNSIRSSKSIKNLKSQKAEGVLEKVITHLAAHHSQLYHNKSDRYLTQDESSHFTILKVGLKGNDTRLKEFCVVGRDNITMIDSGLIHQQYMNDHNLEANKAAIGNDDDDSSYSTTDISLIKVAAMLITKLIGEILQPFEGKQCQLNENIKDKNGGLLVKIVLHQIHERKKQDLTESQLKSLVERENLAKEVLQTERSYITSLSKLIELYYYPLTKHLSHYMNEADRSKIFSGLLNIYQLHKTLMVQLESRLSEWSDRQKIADIFVELSPTFLVYTQFTTKYETAVETFSTARNNPHMGNFLFLRRKDPYCHQHTLNSFLIMPIQRVPRYKMLLEGILKHTEPSHPDYENLVNAAAKMSQVADHLNEKIRERQNFHKMKLVSQKISGIHPDTLIQPNRRYLSEFILKHKLNSTMTEDCVLFLFTDLLIHCVQKEEEVSSKRFSTLSLRKKSPMSKSRSLNNIAAQSNDPSSNNDIDIMGILEDDKSGVTYELRSAIPLASIQLHPLSYSNLNTQPTHRFQVQTNQQNQILTFEYMVSTEDEKNRILTLLNDAIQKAASQRFRN
jgi:hypothetical protein